MNKQKELEILAKHVETCNECQKDSIGVSVFGEGNINADIMFVGEAPGKNEAKIGRPFIGRSGKLLRQCIQDAGLKEEEVYITSPVKYLPERGTPSKTQIAHAKSHFDQQVAIIQPKVIVLLGKTASFALLNRDVPVLKEHGSLIIENNRTYLLTIHPSAALRFPKYKQLLISDFEKLKAVTT